MFLGWYMWLSAYMNASVYEKCNLSYPKECKHSHPCMSLSINLGMRAKDSDAKNNQPYAIANESLE